MKPGSRVAVRSSLNECDQKSPQILTNRSERVEPRAKGTIISGHHPVGDGGVDCVSPLLRAVVAMARVLHGPHALVVVDERVAVTAE